MKTNEFIFLDGGMGTMLQAAGLPVGMMPELWNLTAPEKVTAVHRQYVEAGSQIVYTNTFGANRLKLGEKAGVDEVVSAAVRAAKAATAGTNARVALDVGPLGQLLEPLGTLTFEEAYDIFREIVAAGEKAGADLVVIETESDLYEVKAAVLAAKEHTDLPVWVTMTFEATGRTFLGVSVGAMALTLDGLGVDALGFNCSLGPKQLMPMVEELRRWTDLPLILKPNAGLPDPETGAYTITPGEFAEEMREAVSLGVTVVGGCCGTTPDFIRALVGALQNVPVPGRPSADRRGVCSARRISEFGKVQVIGERINPTGKKRFQQALREGDMDYILERAVEQQDAGAQILDINVGLPGINEPEMMVRVVKAVQSVSDLPLQIDASDPAAIEAGLRAVNGRAIVNSVNGKPEVLDKILPLCKKYGAAVVGLTMDADGIPETWQKRVELAKRIEDACLRHGIPRSDLLIDCLTLTISAQQEQANETLTAVEYVSREMGLGSVLGVSNISFGMPEREHITVSFLTQALRAGLTHPIVNPNLSAIMDAICAFRALSGEDERGEAYIARFAGRKKDEPVRDSHELTLAEAIGRGLKTETRELTRKALETMSELDVVDQLLIPALDRIGEQYERQEIFLPQLISAAGAVCEGFELVRAGLAGKGEHSVSKGKIILATVQGDIHDIGKNIVKVVLENYGYTVLDLGRDVPPERVVEAAIREDVYLIGLSALMTTTVGAMEQTIKALRESGHDCKVMVGGAVLTPEYAEKIGADYYARDAKCSADIAKIVLG